MKKTIFLNTFILLFLLLPPIFAQEKTGDDRHDKKEMIEQQLDEISVTATRIERKTVEVPASIAVVTKETLEDSKMHNIRDALIEVPGVQVQSKNGGYDSRLVIRGAGLKADYGVREIMVLLNGIPITDPDSFTRFDLIDSQQIERVEVVKGPNSTMWGTNAAGGVVNIITKTPLTEPESKIQAGVGNFNSRNLSLYHSGSAGESLLYSVSASHRSSDNSWRRWNTFSTNQYSIQPTFVLDDGTTIENYLSYSQADLQLPGSLDETMFKDYESTGEANDTSGLWRYSGRYSKSIFLSSKMSQDLGGYEFKPMVFFNKWEHHHPVYARINDADTMTYGMDLQLVKNQSFGDLTVGVTVRYDDQKTDYYEYSDVTTRTVTSGRGTAATTYNSIFSVNSDKTGDLIEKQTRATQLSGVYLQESLRPNENWVVDVGLRYDQVRFDIDGKLYRYFDSNNAAYVDCSATATECDDIAVSNHQYNIEKSYQAFSPRVGASYKITDGLHVFGNFGNGIQTPTEGEISENPDLKLVTVNNYEGGLKIRKSSWSMDGTFYQTYLENEVVTVLQEDGTTAYANAGKTEKRGVELNGTYRITVPLSIGGSLSLNDYKYTEYSEQVRSGRTLVNVDRSGNTLPYAPAVVYTTFIRYKSDSGLKFKFMTDSWGSYFVDSENSERYEGYSLVTSAMVGYEWDKLDVTFNVDNLTDKRYATEVKKSYGNKYYTPAAPRSFMLSAKYQF
ncbi:TonB-dependent receptor [bacterium]|nr:TonB-dependent receptor [bacterium]